MKETLSTIIVEPTVPFTTPKDDVEELAQRLRGLDTGYDVRYGLLAAGGGFDLPPDILETLSDFVRVWLPAAWDAVDGPLVGAITAEVVRWASERIRRESRDEKAKIRTKVVELVGADGEVLRRIEVPTEGDAIIKLREDAEPGHKRRLSEVMDQLPSYRTIDDI